MSEEREACCPAFSEAVAARIIWWNGLRRRYGFAPNLPIAFCPFCGASVTAVPE